MDVIFDQDAAIEGCIEEAAENARAEGKVKELIDLVSEGLLSKEIAAKRLNMSKEEFAKLL